MIYLDNAATGGEKPQNVLTAVHSALQLCANPGRGAHRLAITCLQAVQACRKALALHFDCPDHDRVIFTKNCTEALNIALQGLLKKGDHVVATCLEHNSVLRPLHYLQNHRGIEYDICPLEKGEIRPQRIADLLRPNTKAVVITAASNVSGYAPDLAAIRRVLPESVLLICDGAQGGGHLPLKMTQLGIDALCLAGHKGLLGIQGSGVLLLSSRANPGPFLFGGTGSLSFTQEMPDFLPDGLEAGTLNYPAILSLFEGVNYLTVHQEEIAQHLKRLTATLIRGLKKIPQIRVYSYPNPCGIVALAHQKHPSEYLSMLLSKKYDIATRGGLHCAPLAHEAYDTSGDGLLRISFGHQNTEMDVENLLSALQAVCEE
jgi:cysteine desulfurase family protein